MIYNIAIVYNDDSTKVEETESIDFPLLMHELEHCGIQAFAISLKETYEE